MLCSIMVRQAWRDRLAAKVVSNTLKSLPCQITSSARRHVDHEVPYWMCHALYLVQHEKMCSIRDHTMCLTRSVQLGSVKHRRQVGHRDCIRSVTCFVWLGYIDHGETCKLLRLHIMCCILCLIRMR